MNAEFAKTAATGILSSWLRNAVTVAATCLTASHPKLAALLLPPGWESALPWLVGVLAAFLMALLSHCIRQARHNKIFDEAFTAGAEAGAMAVVVGASLPVMNGQEAQADKKPSPFPHVSEIKPEIKP